LVLIRGRTEDDIGRCELLAHAVHDVDGYPGRLPTDMRSFLVAPDELAAWVAEVEGEIVGHVGLHSRCTSATTNVLGQVMRLKDDELGVVARLFVSPTARRQGIGRRLLSTATEAARSRGLVPVLEVVTWLGAAVSMYEALGWARVGTAAFRFTDGTDLPMFVYVFSGQGPPTSSEK
jgi:GNAT superfamily N-acetyltransferase